MKTAVTKSRLQNEKRSLKRKRTLLERSAALRNTEKKNPSFDEYNYRALFNKIHSGIAYHKIVLNRQGLPVDYIFLEVNNTFEKYTGLKRKQILGKKVTEIIPGIRAAKPDLISIYGQVAITGKQASLDIFFAPLNKWYSIAAYSPRREYFIVSFYDITDRKKAEEQIKRDAGLLKGMNLVFQGAMVCDTDEQVAAKCLGIAEKLTCSRFGFIGEINAKGLQDILAVSDPGWSACRIPRKEARKKLSDMPLRGLWGRVLKSGKALLTNDPSSHPDSSGVPKGHPALTSFLGVPVRHKGKTVGLFAVANKPGGYKEDDRKALEGLTIAFTEALYHKRAETALQGSYEELEARVKARTLELSEANKALHNEIIQHKKTEKALTLSQDRYRGIFESSPVSLWEEDFSEGKKYLDSLAKKGISDLRDYFKKKPQELLKCALMVKVVDVNRATLDLFRAKNKQELYAGLSRVFGKESFEVFREELIALAEGKTSFTREAVNESLDGESLHVILGLSVVPGYEATLSKVLVSIFDISDRKRAEQKLDELLEELRRSNRELEQFAYIASHDLQEPLRIVTSYTQLLAKRYCGRFDADADEFLDFIVDGTARMQRLIQDLLKYSRVQAVRADLRPLELTGLLQKVITALSEAIREAGAVIEAGPLPVINGDETQFFMLFQNLIGNAVKFRSGRAPRIRVSAEEGEEEWLFKVSDNGIGIQSEYFSQIFVIFQRLHRSDEYPGTGIGLAICKKIVELHGGKIWVNSVPGKGSEFCFTIAKKRRKQV